MNTEILKKYIRKHHDWEYIDFDYFNIDGANCEVKFYTDESHCYIETININIWDMVMFLNVL
jgi:UDP-glucose 4-epimerase